MKSMNVSPTIRTLRDKGYYTKIFHVRTTDDDGSVLPNGGATVCAIYDADTPKEQLENATPLVISVAECSFKDNYNKKLGTAIVLGRACKVLREKGIL